MTKLSLSLDRVRALLDHLIYALPWILPAYVVRLRIFGLPTTCLEVYLAFCFILFSIGYGVSGWAHGWQRIRAWRWPVLAWLAISLIEVFVSPSLRTGFGLWRAYILEPILLFIILPVVLATSRKRQIFKYSLFGVVCGLTLWASYQFLSGHFIPSPWNVSIAKGRRATGPFPFPNALALFVTPLGAWAMAEWVNRPRRWAYLIGGLVALLSIGLARSDGGLVAFLVSLVIALSLVGWGRRVVLVGAGIAAIILAASLKIRNAIIKVLSFRAWSGQVRVIMWHETWNMLKAHWLFGAGFGGYPIVFKAYHLKRFIEIFQYPHTIIFNFWSETGLIGLGVFIWIVCRWINQSLHVKNITRTERYIVLAPLVAILVHGLVDVPYFKNDLAMLFWIYVFYAMSLHPLATDERNG